MHKNNAFWDWKFHVRLPCYSPVLILPACFNDINTLRPRQNGRRFASDTFKRIFLNQNVFVLINFSLKFVPSGPINNIPTLVQVMAWRRPGTKPLSEPMMVRLPTHICVTRPQWVKWTGLTIGCERYFRHCGIQQHSDRLLRKGCYCGTNFVVPDDTGSLHNDRDENVATMTNSLSVILTYVWSNHCWLLYNSDLFYKNNIDEPVQNM